jgi:nucleoside-diphosphate-sugar epimerase
LISDRIVSIEKIKRELGFKPEVSIDTAGKQLAFDFLKTE